MPTATVTCVVATSGSWEWAELARTRAVPSCEAAQPDQLIVQHGPRQTVCEARNQAAQACGTDWLVFVDADDELTSGYFQALRSYLTSPELLVAPYVSYVLYEGGMGTPAIPNAGRWPDLNDAITATAISASWFRRLGGWDHRYWPWSDWELWLRACKAGARKLHAPECVYRAYSGPHGENNKHPNPRQLHAQIKRLHHQVWVT
jgi:glycosyltransferase involved in cell wall biosynthesis